MKYNWFHISRRCFTELEKEVILKPRIINDSVSDIKGICVCPSVEQCLLAIPNNNYKRTFHIYGTNDVPSNEETKLIYDYGFTEEYRFHENTKFKYIDSISKENMHYISIILNGFHTASDELSMKDKIRYSKYVRKALNKIII